MLLRLLKLRQLRRIRRRGLCVHARFAHRRPGVGHFDERRFFKIGRPGNRRHEIWNKVRPPLVIGLDLGPGAVGLLRQPDQPVVTSTGDRNDHNYNHAQHDQNPATDCQLFHTLKLATDFGGDNYNSAGFLYCGAASVVRTYGLLMPK